MIEHPDGSRDVYVTTIRCHAPERRQGDIYKIVDTGQLIETLHSRRSRQRNVAPQAGPGLDADPGVSPNPPPVAALIAPEPSGHTEQLAQE